jgi:predicted XRE-type DNA-binding protein
MAKSQEKVEAGTGNVFADLGYEDAEERSLRVRLAMRLNEALAERDLPQTAVAELLGIAQPHVSELRHYKLTRFSSERLLHFLTRLDRDIEIRIRPKAKGRAAGSITVSAA